MAFQTITATGAGSWTIPAGITSITIQGLAEVVLETLAAAAVVVLASSWL